MKKIELKPNELFYQNFRLYAPAKKCKECGQKIKNKRPNTHFYFLGFVKGNPNFVKVIITGRKNPSHLHKHYFEPFE